MTAERSNSVNVVAAAGATWDRPRQCWTLPAEVPVGATETWRFNVDSPAHSRTHCIACERKILENDLRVGYPAEDKFSADGVRSLFLHVHCLTEELVSNDATLAELCRDRDSAGVQAWLAGHVVGFESLAKKKKAMLVQGFCETLPPAVNKSPKKTPAVMESDEQPASCRDDELSKRGSSQDRVNLSYADVCEPATELTPVDRAAGDLLRELTVETPGLPDCGNIGTPLKDRSSKYLGAWRLNSDGPSSANSAAADREYHYMTATSERQETKYLGSWRTEGAPSPISSRYPVGAPVRLVPSYRSKGKGYHSEPYWGRGNTHGKGMLLRSRRYRYDRDAR
ncbi:hypothetical protein FOZ62_004865 [Perkinsus olseni]|uniref:PARP-type domain-containing protein n=1 Tax=Perkinsus olseni TaxID=32597 RepID=A0A7J6NKE7_PEROL|nr:hypothetical protein FOZ62_004865 [Perkinsus olseni]